ncbi:MAG: aromatic ring-hydroxylating dioxygenase subunit alpha, partial [Ilumatobacteraceae bacterium]
EKPKNAPIRHLGVDEPFTDEPGLGMLAKVFEQDVFNMSKVQLGLETTRKPGITLANYQESKVRWLHQRLGEFIDEGRKAAQ